MSIQISIIIPVYQVEKYLEGCLDSIIANTCRNCEVILVDDGSTDFSGEICDRYAKKYDFISTFHQKNSGVSTARNLGIEKAIGKYIVFVDADDLVNKEYLSTLYRLIEQPGIQLASVGYTRELSELKSENLISQDDYYTGVYVYQHLLNDPRFDGYLWNKIFSLQIIKDNQLRFENVQIWEDMLFIAQYLKFVTKVVCHYKVLYFYRQQTNGLSYKIDDKKAYSKVIASRKIFQTNDIKATRMYNESARLMSVVEFEFLFRNLKHISQDKEKIKLCIQDLDKMKYEKIFSLKMYMEYFILKCVYKIILIH